MTFLYEETSLMYIDFYNNNTTNIGYV